MALGAHVKKFENIFDAFWTLNDVNLSPLKPKCRNLLNKVNFLTDKNFFCIKYEIHIIPHNDNKKFFSGPYEVKL